MTERDKEFKARLAKAEENYWKEVEKIRREMFPATELTETATDYPRIDDDLEYTGPWGIHPREEFRRELSSSRKLRK